MWLLLSCLLRGLKQLWYYLHSKFSVLTVLSILTILTNNSKQLTSSEPAAFLDLLLLCFVGTLILSSRACSFGCRLRVERWWCDDYLLCSMVTCAFNCNVTASVGGCEWICS